MRKTKKSGASVLTPSIAKGFIEGRRLSGLLCLLLRVRGFAPFFRPLLWDAKIHLWGCFGISSNVHQLNEEIRDSEIRLIGSTGEQLGIMSAAQAQHIADEQGLDLVKISPQANPPVCKLMDYGKFRFEQSKREKEARKNQHVVEIKEVRMSPGIDVGDFNTKLKNAQKFLSEGDRVKVSVRFRGREMAHTEIGRDLLLRFAEQASEIAVMDKEPKMEGRSMSIFLSPRSGK